jgi:hypothetical protein
MDVIIGVGVEGDSELIQIISIKGDPHCNTRAFLGPESSEPVVVVNPVKANWQTTSSDKALMSRNSKF